MSRKMCSGFAALMIGPNMNGWKLAAISAVSIVATVLVCKRTKRRRLTKLPPRSEGIESLIGNTPLVKIRSLSKQTRCNIYAKMELNNPAGSAKDRIAYEIIHQNEKNGLIRPNQGDVIFEGTSGSTGISFTTYSNSMGYKTHICLPDDTSNEKMLLLKSLGAELEPVKPASIVDPNQYVNMAKRGAEAMNSSTQTNRAIFADQFENDHNWRVHYNTTGPEIYEQMEHNVDCFVAGSGTGGTIAGVSKYLKGKNPMVKCVLADPQGSGLANRVNYGVMYDSVEKEGTRRRHQVDTIIEGIGLNRLTWNFKQAEPFIDEAIKVSDDQAVKMARYLCINDGFFFGSSTCINCVAAVKYCEKLPAGSDVVLIACDSGARHMSKFWSKASNYPTEISLEEVMA